MSIPVPPGAPGYSEGVVQVAIGSVFQFRPEFWHDYWYYVTGSILSYILGGGLLYTLAKYQSRASLSQRQIAYLLSCISSTLTTLLSVPMMIYALWAMTEDTTDIALRDTLFYRALFSSTPYTEATMVFYLVFLHLDLIGGISLYPEHMEFISGWGHHIIFILIVNNALYYGWTAGLTAFFVEELPTAILAVGSVFPSLRSDFGFGISFMLTRLAYHTGLTLAICVKVESALCWIGVLTLILHLWWFVRWIIMMQKYGTAEPLQLEEELIDEYKRASSKQETKEVINKIKQANRSLQSSRLSDLASLNDMGFYISSHENQPLGDLGLDDDDETSPLKSNV